MSVNRFFTLSSVIATSSLLLAGCSLPFLPKSETPTGPQGALDQAANAAKLSVMMATGQAGTCTITNTAETEASPMEIAVKGKKFRMKGNDFGGVSQIDQPETNPELNKVGYMLNDGEYLYFWQDQATAGMKMKIQPTITPDPKANETESNTMYTPDDQNPIDQFETDEKYRIDCVLGNVADEVVVPPATVKFTDLSQAMNFPGVNKLPDTTAPEGMNYPDLPTDLPADSNDSGE